MIEELKPDELEQLKTPLDQAAPVFAAPWEASAFALVLTLYRTGYFEWREWVDLLSQEIGSAPPDTTGGLYYERWARALEKLVDRLGLIAPGAIGARSERWREAYLSTPHGQEVLLSNARCGSLQDTSMTAGNL
ncbi:MAG: nitrile hydratase [Rhodospirillales bacterium]|nr:nitrile hydratase [Rhodospirillales bacterium]